MPIVTIKKCRKCGGPHVRKWYLRAADGETPFSFDGHQTGEALRYKCEGCAWSTFGPTVSDQLFWSGGAEAVAEELK